MYTIIVMCFTSIEVAQGMIRPHFILLYYSSYIFYVACTFCMCLPTTLVISSRSMTISWITIVVGWGVIHKLVCQMQGTDL
jgi:hypothetical protein